MITNEDVKKIAFLSRIKIDEDKVEATKEEFNGIIKWVEQLNEVDTTSVEPLASVNEDYLSMREDIVTDGNAGKEVLANAPDAEYGYFTVPKVVE